MIEIREGSMDRLAEYAEVSIAFRTDGVHMKLEGRDDLAVLWDIRVEPEARGRGAAES